MRKQTKAAFIKFIVAREQASQQEMGDEGLVRRIIRL